MKIILTKKGEKIFIDDNQYERLSKYKWYVVNDDSGNKYARRNGGKFPHQTCVSMHREIINPQKKLQVDHIDGNGLNNQGSNLRVCTNSQNSANRSYFGRNKSGFRGVSWDSHRKKWGAYIGFQNKIYKLGFYKSALEAKKIYDAKAKILFGEFYNNSIL